jgi:hypothetical protein
VCRGRRVGACLPFPARMGFPTRLGFPTRSRFTARLGFTTRWGIRARFAPSLAAFATAPASAATTSSAPWR